MTLRERAADAMRLKDAEMRGVVGAPAWGQLTTTDQGRWLALHDAAVDARTTALVSREHRLPFASLRVVSDKTRAGTVLVRGCVVEVAGEPVAEITTTNCQVISSPEAAGLGMLVVTTPLGELTDVQSWVPERD